MSLHHYYRRCITDQSLRVPTSSGYAYLIPPKRVPPGVEDFEALEALAKAGKLRDIRYIDVQPQPIFLAEAGPFGNS